MPRDSRRMVSVDEAGGALGVSASTVWRMIRRGELPSTRERGRRRVPLSALDKAPRARAASHIPVFNRDHPIFRLAGAGRSGGRTPGARRKHDILDR